MIVIYADSVDHAYSSAVQVMKDYGQPDDSRNGKVLSPPCPITTVYTQPQRRVILNKHRDANPFFHLFESLWMLSGRRDATWLDKYVADFSARYGEEDGTQYGAYGYRWRRHFQNDQLGVIVRRLRRDPKDRRVVIQMWDPYVDLFDTNESPEPRDVPCNTQIYPRIVNGKLDVTVTCRSNDVVWGAYGANAVHFSMLHEYLAGRLGVQVGNYYQISNNWHLYESVRDRFQPDETLGEYPGYVSIGENWDQWDHDCMKFVNDPTGVGHTFANQWFYDVPCKMATTHDLWKRKNKLGARQVADSIMAPDWRKAVVEWMERRS